MSHIENNFRGVEVKICIVNDYVKPLILEKENFWTWLVEYLPATPISFAELKIPLEEAIEKEKPDIIICNDLWGLTFPDYFTITIAQNNYVEMQRLLGIDYSDMIKKQKNALRSSQIRVANSNYSAHSYKDCGDFKVIPIGTDTKLFRPMDKQAMRGKYGIPNKMVYIWVGSHHPVKGWDKIQQKIMDYKDIFWILVFKDHGEQELKNTKVFCRIPQEQLAELYNCADACISESVVESLGLAIIEAMFCGIPVLATRTGFFWDEYPPMKDPRQEAFDLGLDKYTCMKKWRGLIENSRVC